MGFKWKAIQSHPEDYVRSKRDNPYHELYLNPRLWLGFRREQLYLLLTLKRTTGNVGPNSWHLLYGSAFGAWEDPMVVWEVRNATILSLSLHPYNLCRLTLWAKWAIAQGPALAERVVKNQRKGGKIKKRKKNKIKGQKRGKNGKKEIK